MSQRWVGLGVVLLVLLIALAAPVIAGRKIVGIATALEVAAEPQVGDCLLHLSGAEVSRVGHDHQLQAVPCTSQHDAEVITQTETVAGIATSKEGGGNIPDLAACASTAYWYLGVHPLDQAGRRSTVLGPWWPAFAAKFESLGPDSLQLRIHQSWAACVMTSPHGLITGSVAHLFGGSALSNPIALCTPDIDIVLFRSVSCDQAHGTEILGWRVADESTNTQSSLEPSCAELARRLTAMADPTAHDVLRLAVVILHSADTAGNEGWGPGHSGLDQAACTISTAEPILLNGSLVGIGDAALPWN